MSDAQIIRDMIQAVSSPAKVPVGVIMDEDEQGGRIRFRLLDERGDPALGLVVQPHHILLCFR